MDCRTAVQRAKHEITPPVTLGSHSLTVRQGPYLSYVLLKRKSW